MESPGEESSTYARAAVAGRTALRRAWGFSRPALRPLAWSRWHVLLLLGALAVAGLTSVRDGQSQVQLGYDLARKEEALRRMRATMVNERARLQALQAPAHVVERVTELKLDLAPPGTVPPVVRPSVPAPPGRAAPSGKAAPKRP